MFICKRINGEFFYFNELGEIGYVALTVDEHEIIQ